MNHATDVRNFKRQMTDYARGERLTSLRKKRRLSQEALAHELGVVTKTVWTWEQGGAISPRNIHRIATFFGVEPEEFVELGVFDGQAAFERRAPYLEGDVERSMRVEAMMTALLKHFGVEWEAPDHAVPQAHVAPPQGAKAAQREAQAEAARRDEPSRAPQPRSGASAEPAPEGKPPHQRVEKE